MESEQYRFSGEDAAVNGVLAPEEPPGAGVFPGRQNEQDRELAFGALTRLQALTAALSHALTAEEVGEVIITQGLATLGASVGVVSVLNNEGTEFSNIRMVGYPQPVAEVWRRFPADAPVALAEAVRTKRPIIFETLAERPVGFPQAMDLLGLGSAGALAAIPMMNGRVVGAVGLSFPTERRFSAVDRAFMLMLAGLCGQALERAHLYDLEWAARERAEHAAERLEEADRRKDIFLATLAHELRNPLAPILSGLHLLKRGGLTGPLAERARETVEFQAQHMARLVDDLLDVSRVSRGQIRLREESVEVAGVIGRALETCGPAIEFRRQHVEVMLEHAPLPLMADSTRLTQVVANLLSNASKYTPEGGRIWLTAERINGEIVLRVRDNGIGIRPEMLPRIFDLFVQEEHGLDGMEGGLGIGLTLVKNLVELHGGSITAYSPGLGQGSEFTIRLPMVPVLQKTRPCGPRTALPQPPGLRILVVDDNEAAAEMLSELLKLDNHEVHMVHEGLAVEKAARDFRPEVVLLDIGLPGLNGYDLAPRLLAQPGLEKMLLVAVTGYGQDEDKQRAWAAGFHAHLVKPVDFEALTLLLANGTVRK